MARTIEGLLDKIYFASGSEAEKGLRFEKLIGAYLQTAGQYAAGPVTFGRFSERSAVWQDWEGRQGEADTGIDIGATDKLTSELWAGLAQHLITRPFSTHSSKGTSSTRITHP